jgi:hypothetical protein
MLGGGGRRQKSRISDAILDDLDPRSQPILYQRRHAQWKDTHAFRSGVPVGVLAQMLRAPGREGRRFHS